MTVKRASPAWPIGAGVLTWTLGSVIFVVLAIRVAIAARPRPRAVQHARRSSRLPAYLGLLCALLIPLGALPQHPRRAH